MEIAALPKELRPLVDKVEAPVSPDTVEAFDRVTRIQDRSRSTRVIVEAWKQQQESDRRMRGTYAKWLLILISAEVILANIAFFLMGSKVLVLDQWVANAFIVGVFAEISALVLVVAKYLFPDTAKPFMDLLGNLHKDDEH